MQVPKKKLNIMQRKNAFLPIDIHLAGERHVQVVGPSKGSWSGPNCHDQSAEALPDLAGSEARC
jgi:hypothetical protein